jgi:hypothetical protein
MDNDIKILVDKIVNAYGVMHGIDRNDLLKRVLYYKSKFNPSKGSFNTYFSTITRNEMIVLYKSDDKRSKRKNKIEKLLLNYK